MLTKHPISRTKSWSIFISLLVAGLLLAGCSLPISTLPAPTLLPFIPSPTLIPPSPTPVPPLAAPTSIPPTATPLPTLTPATASGNIVFATGTTAGVVQGTVQPGQVVAYTLSAGQSQPLILILESPHKDVTLGVLEPNGNKLLDPAKKWTRLQWLLPRTEVYTIQVIGGPMVENYTLTVKVAQLVNFAS
ncbi:MAG TPA: hypothetical protein VF359_11645, partial [Anaerolineales bacterium]